MSDGEVLKQIAEARFPRMTPVQQQRIAERGELIAEVPKVEQLAIMKGVEMVNTLLNCPFSDFYGWASASLNRKLDSEHKVRIRLENMAIKWRTFRALPDIQEQSFEQSEDSFQNAAANMANQSLEVQDGDAGAHLLEGLNLQGQAEIEEMKNQLNSDNKSQKIESEHPKHEDNK